MNVATVTFVISVHNSENRQKPNIKYTRLVNVNAIQKLNKKNNERKINTRAVT